MSPPAISWPDPARRERFDAWWRDVADTWQLDAASLQPASADASFRRYLRAEGRPGSRVPSAIVMDAPPPQEDVRPFLHVGRLLAEAGLNVPEVMAHDVSNGFLLLGDLGNRLLLRELTSARDAGDARRCDRLMRASISTLVQMQSAAASETLPPYDEALLRRELQLFPDWCVEREHGVAWTDAHRSLWAPVTDALVGHALAQPTVFVHRDYMPRNLMVPDATGPDLDPGLGVLDFQDAVRGPITYDPVCLLRDAFIGWDEEREIDWAIRYWEQARKAGLPVDSDFGGFWRALEWMGVQRHLKVLGIFCRLKHRDAKPAYSAELPRFFRYVHRVATRYREFAPLVRLIEPLMGEQRLDAYY